MSDRRYERIGMQVWDCREKKVVADLTDESGRTGNMIADALNGEPMIRMIDLRDRLIESNDALRAENERLKGELECHETTETMRCLIIRAKNEEISELTKKVAYEKQVGTDLWDAEHREFNRMKAQWNEVIRERDAALRKLEAVRAWSISGIYEDEIDAILSGGGE